MSSSSALCPVVFAIYWYLYGLEEAAMEWLCTAAIVFHWWLLGGLSIAVRDIRIPHTLHPAIAMINAHLFRFPSSPVAVCGLMIYYAEFQHGVKKRIPESKYMHHECFWVALFMYSCLPTERDLLSCISFALFYVVLGSAWYYISVRDPAVDHHEIQSIWQVIKPLFLPVLVQVVIVGYALSLLNDKNDFFFLSGLLT